MICRWHRQGGVRGLMRVGTGNAGSGVGRFLNARPPRSPPSRSGQAGGILAAVVGAPSG